MTYYQVGMANDFNDGDRKVVVCGDKEIAVFKLDGHFYAWHNRCAHQGGPVCQGRIMKRVVELLDAGGRTRAQHYDETQTHIICPWHGYEFSIRTGEHPGNPRIKLLSAKIEIREGEIGVSL